MNDILDQTLPPELQKVVPPPTTQATAATQTPNETKGEKMEITPETIEKTVANLLAAKDKEQAIASKITGLTTERDSAVASLATANTKVADLTKSVSDKDAAITAASTKVTDLEKQLATAAAEKGSLQAQLNKITSDKAVASRKQALAEVGVNKDEVVGGYVALNEDGTLKVSDESFNATVATMKAVFEAGKASKPAPAAEPAATTTTTPAAPATTPAATATATDKQPENKTENTPAQASATTAAPAAPDLSDADKYQQATAALLNGQKKPSSGKGRFTAIGCGV